MRKLDQRIDDVRRAMYQAYEKKVSYHELLRISQELDRLLNQMEHGKKVI
ncbi:aspartyl-phosphate phosphatase Spo0E family protein [Gracilibacillus kekensis]|uniref:Spo0E like sporulation regulatory protein n=1 Tax=Gracilibacillus kekensis TaxID=1027249 RepID=A0A1M7JND3_9BACI|nr:aspartyl-phosphate phosphatase Spo0E family protein [Gracilibacillus kekensis]SHM54047.1 Spo0E like sporulation regulatory protein [Gracilibacillus kekensis]